MGRLELVDAEAGHDGDEVGPDGPDRFVAPADPTDGGVLHDVLGVGGAPQHAVRNAEEERPPLLERRRVGLDVTQRQHGQTSRLSDAVGGISQVSEKPWLCRPNPALNRDRIFSTATHAASSTISAALNTLRSRAASSSETWAGQPDAVSAYSRTARSLRSNRSLSRHRPADADLGRIDAFVHAFVVGVVSAPRAADGAGGRLDGQPAQGRVELLHAHLRGRLQGTDGHQDARMMCGSGHGLDHSSEPAFRVTDRESGDDAPGFVNQRDMCHVVPPFARGPGRQHHETERPLEL